MQYHVSTLCDYRGFGFVKFEDPNAVDKVLQHPIHALDNKTVGILLRVIILSSCYQRYKCGFVVFL